MLGTHLEKLYRECYTQSNVFWNYFSVLSHYDSLIGIPTIVLSSITSLSSLTNLTNNTNNDFITTLTLLTPLFAILSTILASLNQYLRYGERAQKAKSQAKVLSEIGRRIQLNKLLIQNDVDLNKNFLLRLTEEIYKELDVFGREIEELPLEFRSILSSISEQGETDTRPSSHNSNTILTADALEEKQDVC